MPDVIAYAGTGVVYSNGTIVVMADKFGNTKKILPDLEHNVVVQQSGILDSRFDNLTYYTA